MKNAILTSVLVLGVATTAFADRGSRYDGGGRSNSGHGGLPVPPGFSRGGGGLPVPPGVPRSLVPGNKHSFLPAPPLPGFGRSSHRSHDSHSSVQINAGFSTGGYGHYREPYYVPAPVYYAPQPVYIAAPVYAPAPVYVSSPQVIYVNQAPVYYAAPPVVIWNPPVCRPSYYGGSGLSVNFSYYR